MADTKREFFSIKGMRVNNVRRIPNTEVITFALMGNGLGLYNLRIVTGGASGKFIAAPSEKGKDGKYHNHYALYLSREDEERVMKAVIDKLPAEQAAAEDTL